MKNSITATGGVSRRSFLGMLGMAGFACAAGLGLTGCEDSAAPAAEAVDYNSMSLDDIIAQAKEEGQINSVGMPDTWANWVGTWDDIEEKYGITQADQDMSSAEEIAMFKQEGTDGTKDIGDVGQQWGPTAEAEGVTLKYKTSYWDEIDPRLGQGRRRRLGRGLLRHDVDHLQRRPGPQPADHARRAS